VVDSKYSLSFRSCESLQAGSSSSTAVVSCCSAMHDEVRSFIHISWILTRIQNHMDKDIVNR
jgi:hypothetical protein